MVATRIRPRLPYSTSFRSLRCTIFSGRESAVGHSRLVVAPTKLTRCPLCSVCDGRPHERGPSRRAISRLMQCSNLRLRREPQFPCNRHRDRLRNARRTACKSFREVHKGKSIGSPDRPTTAALSLHSSGLFPFRGPTDAEVRCHLDATRRSAIPSQG
jgi:hypothetical protein